ncbi:MAG: hypothetical protein JWP97_3953 [Labilithrix sp.]|nr:hypothetical protein [Labilithrix sp.]
MSRAAVVALGVLLAVTQAGCTKSQLVDLAMSGADHPAAAPRRVGEWLVLGGDMHCHVMPPDAPYHVARELPSTVALAKREGLDFVVLTPHARKRFFENDASRQSVLETQAELRARIAALAPDLLVIPGLEYTDFRYGHVGVSFADPAAVLGDLPAGEAAAHPARFFERWVAAGGVLTINHPVTTPLPEVPFHELRSDMSWRAFRGATVPEEIAWITAHAQAIESYNTTVTHLRDQFLVGDEDRSLREVAHLVDRVSRAQRRKIAAVGGSDSHGEWLRATTFVLARERSAPALRDGLVAARTCVRGPEACTLEARASKGGPWARIGDSLRTVAKQLAVRVTGRDVRYVVNGVVAATQAEGAETLVPLPEGCAIVRAVVARSWSSGIYVNCGF